jgi:hypothetical protein
MHGELVIHILDFVPPDLSHREFLSVVEHIFAAYPELIWSSLQEYAVIRVLALILYNR